MDYIGTSMKFLEGLKEYLFPLYCMGCSREGSIVCKTCIKNIPTRGVFYCPICHVSTPQGICCKTCKESSVLSQQIAINRYTEGDLFTDMIHLLKYEYVEEVLSPLSYIVNEFIQKLSTIFSSIDTIVPVPLHPKRYAERGYNQAELIARMISYSTGTPVQHLLQRHRATQQQALLSKVERLSNVKRAFATDQHMVVGKRILLVDDVYTTGATMQECAFVLKEQSHEITGFTLARG